MKKLLLVLGIAAVIGLVSCENAPETGFISIISTPTGAAITLDGTALTQTTDVVLSEIEPGDHTVLITLDGYDDYTETVKVVAGDTVEVSADLEEQLGNLQVNSTPTGATILIDDVDSGDTTNTLIENLTATTHTVKLTLTDYEDWDTTVTIIADSTVTIDATLIEKTGSLQVNSNPVGAAIWLDGANTGQVTNYLLEDVALGDHTLRLVLDGYEDWEGTVTVNADQTTTVDTTLEEEETLVEYELRQDEAIPTNYGFKLQPGYKMAAHLKPPSYPFDVTEAAYVPIGWQDDPDNWNANCNLVFFADGEEPGAELGRKQASAATQMAFNWFDVSDLNITIEEGDMSFYFAVENIVADNPGLALDGSLPQHDSSWLYALFQGDTDPKWVNFDNIDVGGWILGDSADVMLRVKGMAPDGGSYILTTEGYVRGGSGWLKKPFTLDDIIEYKR